MYFQPISIMDNSSESPFMKRRNRRKRSSQVCYQIAYGCLNIFIIGVCVLLIGITVYGSSRIQLVTIPVISGILVSGILFIFLSLIGFVGMSNQNQVLLYMYMVTMVLFSLLIFSLSIAALILSGSNQLTLIMRQWSTSNEVQLNNVEMALNCCGLFKGEIRKKRCDMRSLHDDSTTSCYEKLEKSIAEALQYSGCLGLFFSLMLMVGAYATTKFRNHLKTAVVI